MMNHSDLHTRRENDHMPTKPICPDGTVQAKKYRALNNSVALWVQFMGSPLPF